MPRKKKAPEVDPLDGSAPAPAISFTPIKPLTFSGIHAQILADQSPELDVEGARNSGKTWVLCAKVAQSCLDYPGIEWLICRYSGTETDNKLRPEFVRVSRLMGIFVEWHEDESAYWFPEVNGRISKVFAYGLKTQDKLALYAKIRGLGVAGVWNDQTEELVEAIGTEIRFAMRQPGFPHQLIFSPNPPGEDHWLADQFPEDEQIPGRKLYRLSIYDNRHNLPDQTIAQIEQMYPPTHARHKSLVLGLRGVNVIGTPVYQDAFDRDVHLLPLEYDPNSELLEAIDSGKHNPTWLVAQRSPMGGIHLLGGIMGKRLFLEDFLQIVQRYRLEWFGDQARVKTCCDPPADAYSSRLRYTNVSILREQGLSPVWRDNAMAADVRESVIQSLAGFMRRRIGDHQAFAINDDPSRWLMASHVIVKRSLWFTDGVEGAYVWDDNFVSVANKKVRQPKTDPWVDGGQRCLENICLNFCAGKPSEATSDREAARMRALLANSAPKPKMPFGMGYLG